MRKAKIHAVAIIAALSLLAVTACEEGPSLVSDDSTQSTQTQASSSPQTVNAVVGSPTDWFSSTEGMKTLQRYLGVTADGVFGPGTLNAVLNSGLSLSSDDITTMRAYATPSGAGERVAGYDIPSNADPYAIMTILQMFPPDDWHEMLRIAYCESHLGAMKSQMWNNSDGTEDFGLFQINNAETGQRLFRMFNGYTPGASELETWLMNDYNNAVAAKQLHSELGIQPWACAYNTGMVTGLWSFTRTSDWCQYKGNGTLGNCY